MSSAKKAAVRTAYNKIKSGEYATLDDLAKNYDPTQSPNVLSGAETAEGHYKNFLSLWEAKKPADPVSYAQFEKFYQAASVTITDDATFTRILKAVWHF